MGASTEKGQVASAEAESPDRGSPETGDSADPRGIDLARALADTEEIP